ncbi:hypothetical protein PQR75_00085 [Paraburkholderia fungorum]|uniref:hypothetical protein n=1 Tax=Paraburkholderia fungorum TaxID=134537 RepID=UPI0038BA6CF1
MSRFIGAHLVAMVAALTVLMSVFVVPFLSTRCMAVAAGFALPVALGVIIRMLAPTAALGVISRMLALPAALRVVTRMLMSMPFVPVGTGFGLFRAVCFGVVRMRHGWLPGSICGLVNTLKPLQGQGRNPEGP